MFFGGGGPFGGGMDPFMAAAFGGGLPARAARAAAAAAAPAHTAAAAARRGRGGVAGGGASAAAFVLLASIAPALLQLFHPVLFLRIWPPALLVHALAPDAGPASHRPVQGALLREGGRGLVQEAPRRHAQEGELRGELQEKETYTLIASLFCFRLSFEPRSSFFGLRQILHSLDYIPPQEAIEEEYYGLVKDGCLKERNNYMLYKRWGGKVPEDYSCANCEKLKSIFRQDVDIPDR
jgi:hypothetical protein